MVSNRQYFQRESVAETTHLKPNVGWEMANPGRWGSLPGGAAVLFHRCRLIIVSGNLLMLMELLLLVKLLWLVELLWWQNCCCRLLHPDLLLLLQLLLRSGKRVGLLAPLGSCVALVQHFPIHVH